MIVTAIVMQAFTAPNSYPQVRSQLLYLSAGPSAERCRRPEPDDVGSWAVQVIILIAITLVLLLFLRLIRPNGDRTALIMAMVGTLCTLGIYICGLLLLACPNASPPFRWSLSPLPGCCTNYMVALVMPCRVGTSSRYPASLVLGRGAL